MRQFFAPANAPLWLRAMLGSIRDALSDVWNSAIRLKDYTTAGLPPAADWKQGLVYDSTLNAPHYSNGTTWVRLSDYDADVAAIAALSTTGLIARTGTGTAATRTITGTANQIAVTNGDGVSGNPTISLPNPLIAPGNITATGAVIATGASAALQMDDRDGTGTFVWYNSGDIVRLWQPGIGDLHTFSSTGLSVTGDITASGVFKVGSTQVLGSRKTGWAAATGTATRTTFDTTTVTTQQLAERVKALLDDLISHGLIGT